MYRLPSLLQLVLWQSLFGLACCTSESKESKDDDSSTVNNVIYQLIAADNQSDVDAILSFYTSDIEFHPKGREISKGIQNIRTNYEAMFKSYRLELVTEIMDTHVDGNIAVVKGINKGSRISLSDGSVTPIHDGYEANLTLDKKGVWKINKLYWSPIDSD